MALPVLVCLALPSRAPVEAPAAAVPIAPAGWPPDSQSGVEVAPIPGSQDDPCVLPDGAGGVFVAWRQSGGRNGDDVFAQRLGPDGTARWGDGGVPVCLAAADQRSPQMVGDGAGGLIVVWEDRRNGRDADLYAQRLDGDGGPVWAADGVPVSLARGDQRAPRLMTDGHGGAWVVWEDLRSGDVELYAQALDANGAPHWSPDGVALVNGPGSQASPDLVGDAIGGVLVTWRDSRRSAGVAGAAEDVYAQRLDPDGNPRWAVNGVAVASGIDAGAHPTAIADGSGGMVVAWEGAAVTTQRIDSTGVPVWGPDGLAISSEPGRLPALVPLEGGVMVVWRSGIVIGGDNAIRVCRVTTSGVVRDSGGVTVSGTRGPKTDLVAIADGAGGAIAGWRDNHDEGFGSTLAQRADSTAAPRWSLHGAVVSSAPGFQRSLRLVSDGVGGVIAVWVDQRHGQHVFAERLGPDGRRGGVVATPVPPAPR